MNPSVSLLAPGGQALPAASASKFREPATCNRDSALFSSVLERAVQQTPTQKNSAPKSVRAKASQSEDSAPDSLAAERRPPVREKNKREARDDEQSLIGAGAVNGQPVKPDETIKADAPVEAAAEDAQTSAASADKASAVGVGTDTAGSLATGTAVVATDVKATTPTAAGATTPLMAEVSSSTTEIPRATEDLIKQLTPTTESSLESVALTPASVAPGNPTIAKALTPGDAVEMTLPNTGDVLDQSSVTTATSARAAEVLLAAGLETDATTSATQPNTLAADTVAATEVPDEARRVARAARRAGMETLENARGIAAAKISETMKTAIKKEEIAGVAQQMLPGAAAVAASVLPNLPGEARRSAASAVSPADALSLAGKLPTTPVRADGVGFDNLRDVRATSPLGRVSELISREVRMFKRGGDDLVEVVLTPDAKTQISLRLQWREGQVEVQARCDLGDHQSLSTQWTQLQSSLAQHGVRLSHLSERAPTGFTEFFNNPSFAQSHGGDRRPESQFSNSEALVSDGSKPVKTAPAKSAVRGSRLFDFWA